MKCTAWVIWLSVIATGVASATEVIGANVCELESHPQQYAGRMVRFVAEWTRSARRILVDDPSGKCGPILIELPNDPDVHPHARFKVIKDAAFEKLLQSEFVLIPNATTHKKGKIRATFQGRFDVAGPRKGFGHGQLYNLRLVLQQVSDVSVSTGESNTDSSGT
jgi:hypothetical protein